MLDFNERAIPGITSNFLMQEAYSRYDFVLKYVKSNSKVLDIACGVGYGTAKIAQKAKDTVGLDINREAIAYAQSHFGVDATYMVADAVSLPFKDRYFDVIVAFEMIEHLDNASDFLREMKRVLKKGGLLIISTPNKDFHSTDGKPMSPYHTKEYNYTELQKLLKKFFIKSEYFAQTKSSRAKVALDSFMTSQGARRGIVFIDFLGIRKLISKQKREVIWKYLGGLFGRQKQESLGSNDFSIKKYKDVAEYFIVVCRT